jgi:hypothetical protein
MNIERKIRRLDLVRWGIIILFTIIGLAFFASTMPVMVIFFILLGWFVGWSVTLALFGLPYTHPLIQWLVQDW